MSQPATPRTSPGVLRELFFLLKPLADLFDDETMRQLNARVDVDHESPSKVAADFLRQHPLN